MQVDLCPVIDLHCDLLSYLQEHPFRTPFDLCCRSSYPQLKRGNVFLQVFALYVEKTTPSLRQAYKQLSLFQQLTSKYPQYFAPVTKPSIETSFPKVYCAAAIENVGGFCTEKEPLELFLKRLDEVHRQLKKIAYISFTWNGENRFGGGAETFIGLKEDGQRLLYWLHQKGIALDVSHTSDALFHDLLNFMDKHSLEIPVMASHSNFRSICPHARNLPDPFALEIIRRKGVIGMNLYAPFVGEKSYKNLCKQIEKGLQLKGEDALSFGADFFYEADFPHLVEKRKNAPAFFPEYSDSSCYPFILHLLQQELSLPFSIIQKIFFGNAFAFLNNLW